MCKKKVAAILVLAACIPALAQAGSAPNELPQKVKELHCMAGKWKMKGTLQAGPDKFPIAGKMRCKTASGGFSLLCTTTITGIPGLDKYEEQDLWGYDASTDSYHMFSVTNGGETHDHSGKLNSKDGSWSGTYEGTVEGKPMVENISFRFTGDDEVSVVSRVTIGGQPASELSGKLVR